MLRQSYVISYIWCQKFTKNHFYSLKINDCGYISCNPILNILLMHIFNKFQKNNFLQEINLCKYFNLYLHFHECRFCYIYTFSWSQESFQPSSKWKIHIYYKYSYCSNKFKPSIYQISLSSIHFCFDILKNIFDLI